MTESQEDLRTAIDAVMNSYAGGYRLVADALEEMFAARVAAIEREQSVAAREWRILAEGWQRRTETAEADLTAAQERLATFTAEHDRIEDLLAATTMRAVRAEERIAALSAKLNNAHTIGWQLSADLSAETARAQRAEERVAAERKQAAAQPDTGWTEAHAALMDAACMWVDRGREPGCSPPNLWADDHDFALIEAVDNLRTTKGLAP